MDDLYPPMNTSYGLAIQETYVYAAAVILIILTCRFIFINDKRFYRITKRKNTEENPITNI